MGDFYPPLLAILLALAFFTRDGFVFTLVYLFAGTYALTRFWNARTSSSLSFERQFLPRAFPGETVRVRLKVANRSRLPIVWLQISESLPVELSRGQNVQQVVTLAPRSSTELVYEVYPRKRGVFNVGPVFFTMGDVLGLLKEEQRLGAADPLIVYPEVIPLEKVRVPSWTPLGRIRHRVPIFEDPSRAAGKRPYAVGDSLRRVDWKATAASGQMQVRLLDPSIALQTVIFLNMREEDYRLRTRFESSELAVLAAAALANWVSERKEPVGIVTNGLDPIRGSEIVRAVPPRSGRAHLMRVLEALARVRIGETLAFETLISREQVRLPWGATMILITSAVSRGVIDELLAARQRGLNLMVVLIGPILNAAQARQQVEALGVPVAYFNRRSDLEQWQ